MNKRNFFLVAAIFLTTFFFSCSNSSDSPYAASGTSSETDSTTDISTPTADSSLEVTYGENATDSALAAVSWTSVIYLDLKNLKYSTDNSTWTAISTNSSSPSAVATNVTVYNDSGYIKIDSSSTADPLKFVLTGTLSSGELFFANKKGGTIGIFMNGASIKSESHPCVEFDKKATSYLCISGTNSLTDGRTYGTDYSSGSTKKGTFAVKGSLNISAADSSASLAVTEGYKHGFYVSDVLNFYGGRVTVNSTGRNGFQCVNGFNMYGGTATVYGNGKNINNQSRGIVIEGDDTGDTDGLGYFNMTGGAVNIKTVSKGITAKWDNDDDASASPTCSVNPVVTISGGTINIITYGTPQDESNSTYTFTDADGETVTETTKLSPEGIEGKAGVAISGGTINVQTTDDCINASYSTAAVTISGGTIFAYSSDNDAIDSNGTLAISGGTIVALTATTPECAFDCDQNTFAITGGTFIGIGTNNYSAPTSSACSQSVVVISGNYLGSGGTTFALENSSGAAAFAFAIPSSVYGSLNSNYVAVFSSPNVNTGTSYSLYSGVAATGGSAFNGLYTTLPTVSGGSATATGISTSTSAYVYTLASSSNGGAKEGSHPNQGPSAH